MTSADLCRARIEHWQHLLTLATCRRPVQSPERLAERERVVATCAERIRAWERRLAALERRAAA